MVRTPDDIMAEMNVAAARHFGVLPPGEEPSYLTMKRCDHELRDYLDWQENQPKEPKANTVVRCETKHRRSACARAATWTLIACMALLFAGLSCGCGFKPTGKPAAPILETTEQIREHAQAIIDLTPAVDATATQLAARTEKAEKKVEAAKDDWLGPRSHRWMWGMGILMGVALLCRIVGAGTAGTFAGRVLMFMWHALMAVASFGVSLLIPLGKWLVKKVGTPERPNPKARA